MKWYIFEEAIESFKKNFNNYDQIGQYYLIDCDIFQNEITKEEELKKLISDFNSKNPSWKLQYDKNWKIKFPFQIILKTHI